MQKEKQAALHTISLDLEAFDGVVLFSPRVAEKH